MEELQGQSTSNTGENPQGTTVSPGASESSDFQESAPANVLNQKAGDLAVEDSSGEAAATVQPTENTDYVPLYWSGSIILVLVIFAVLILRILQSGSSKAPVATAPAETAKPKSTNKKASTKKKSPPHKRKKSSKKKR